MQTLARYIKGVINIAIIILLSWMVLVSGLELLARWVLNSGITWAGVHLRQSVLLIALLGGVLASAEQRHIKIDLLKNYLGASVFKKLMRFLDALAATILLILSYHSIVFIRSEKAAGTKLRNFLFGDDIQYWHIELFLPICFILMAFFFLTSALHSTVDKD